MIRKRQGEPSPRGHYSTLALKINGRSRILLSKEEPTRGASEISQEKLAVEVCKMGGRSCSCVEGLQSMEEGIFGGRGKKKSRATGAAAFEVLGEWFFEIHHGNTSCNLER